VLRDTDLEHWLVCEEWTYNERKFSGANQIKWACLCSWYDYGVVIQWFKQVNFIRVFFQNVVYEVLVPNNPIHQFIIKA
jgi:hypothetical protein